MSSSEEDEVTRREAMLLIAAAGASGTAACSPRPKSAKEEGKVIQSSQERPDPILKMEAMGFPWATPDPFLFCVHHDDSYPAGNERMGPAASLAGRDIGQDFAGLDGWRMYHGTTVPGFPQHPHRGFETVTIVRKGLLDHSDSLGAAARFGDGDVQWLTAGKGINHAEMFPLLHKDRGNPAELFQIWLNLPREDKLVEPHFAMLWNHVVPRQVTQDSAGRSTELRVIAGRLPGLTPAPPPPKSWASRPDTDVAIWTLKLAPGAQWTLPSAAKGSNRRLYFFKGNSLQVAGRALKLNHFVDLRPELEVPLQNGGEEAELLLLQGKPIAEPVAQHGPFVMNTRAELVQAFSDYQRTQFGGWPWASNDPVHPREEGRFARHADGHIERPT